MAPRAAAVRAPAPRRPGRSPALRPTRHHRRRHQRPPPPPPPRPGSARPAGSAAAPGPDSWRRGPPAGSGGGGPLSLAPHSAGEARRGDGAAHHAGELYPGQQRHREVLASATQPLLAVAVHEPRSEDAQHQHAAQHLPRHVPQLHAQQREGVRRRVVTEARHPLDLPQRGRQGEGAAVVVVRRRRRGGGARRPHRHHHPGGAARRRREQGSGGGSTGGGARLEDGEAQAHGAPGLLSVGVGVADVAGGLRGLALRVRRHHGAAARLRLWRTERPRLARRGAGLADLDGAGGRGRPGAPLPRGAAPRGHHLRTGFASSSPRPTRPGPAPASILYELVWP